MAVINRRDVLLGMATAAAPIATGLADVKPAASEGNDRRTRRRSRVLIVNDLSGDVDGVFATAHAVLSESAEVRGIVGTRTFLPGETAQHSTAVARELLELMGLADQITALEGAADKLGANRAPIRSPGVDLIIEEALRTDTSLPFYVTVGGGLTEVASALMLEPRISDRFTLVWIGGLASKDGDDFEFNTTIDPIAAQYVFNESAVRIWQVPSVVYSTCIVSVSELRAHVEPCGTVGKWLFERLLRYSDKLLAEIGLNTGETYVLGDSPLVLLTALIDSIPQGFQPPFKYERTASSKFEEIVTPRLSDTGAPEPRTSGRKMRRYLSVDTRLLYSDFYAKLRTHFQT